MIWQTMSNKTKITLGVRPDEYQRPDFLQTYSEADFVRFSSHANRPVVEPKSESCLPKGVGYAEIMNAGKLIAPSFRTAIEENKTKQK